MINLHDIRYARLGTPDLDCAIRFATEIVGLQLVAREGKRPISAATRSTCAAIRATIRLCISRAIPPIRPSAST